MTVKGLGVSLKTIDAKNGSTHDTGIHKDSDSKKLSCNKTVNCPCFRFCWSQIPLLSLLMLTLSDLLCQGDDTSRRRDSLSGKCQEAVYVWCGPPPREGNKSLQAFNATHRMYS